MTRGYQPKKGVVLTEVTHSIAICGVFLHIPLKNRKPRLFHSLINLDATFCQRHFSKFEAATFRTCSEHQKEHSLITLLVTSRYFSLEARGDSELVDQLLSGIGFTFSMFGKSTVRMLPF